MKFKVTISLLLAFSLFYFYISNKSNVETNYNILSQEDFSKYSNETKELYLFYEFKEKFVKYYKSGNISDLMSLVYTNGVDEKSTQAMESYLKKLITSEGNLILKLEALHPNFFNDKTLSNNGYTMSINPTNVLDVQLKDKNNNLILNRRFFLGFFNDKFIISSIKKA